MRYVLTDEKWLPIIHMRLNNLKHKDRITIWQQYPPVGRLPSVGSIVLARIEHVNSGVATITITADVSREINLSVLNEKWGNVNLTFQPWDAIEIIVNRGVNPCLIYTDTYNINIP